MKYMLLACLVIFSGCSKYVIQQDLMQEAFLKKCPEDLPYAYSPDGGGWLEMARDWSSLYHQCRIVHNGTVDAIRLQ